MCLLIIIIYFYFRNVFFGWFFRWFGFGDFCFYKIIYFLESNVIGFFKCKGDIYKKLYVIFIEFFNKGMFLIIVI